MYTEKIKELPDVTVSYCEPVVLWFQISVLYITTAFQLYSMQLDLKSRQFLNGLCIQSFPQLSFQTCLRASNLYLKYCSLEATLHNQFSNKHFKLHDLVKANLLALFSCQDSWLLPVSSYKHNNKYPLLNTNSKLGTLRPLGFRSWWRRYSLSPVPSFSFLDFLPYQRS